MFLNGEYAKGMPYNFFVLFLPKTLRKYKMAESASFISKSDLYVEYVYMYIYNKSCKLVAMNFL